MHFWKCQVRFHQIDVYKARVFCMDAAGPISHDLPFYDNAGLNTSGYMRVSVCQFADRRSKQRLHSKKWSRSKPYACWVREGHHLWQGGS
jgi:hypothetical protein